MGTWMNKVVVVMESSKDRLISMYKAPLINLWNDIAPTGEITRKDLYDAMKNVRDHLKDLSRYVKSKGNETGKWDAIMVLDEEYMTKVATNYAEDQIAKVNAKILSKIEEVDNVTEVRVNLSALEFTFVGTRGDKTVSLTQRAIFNTSSKGTPFVQFPARFYVGGKPMSEAAYKKLFA